MARTNNLTNFLTDVAGAIKEKKAYPEGTKIAAANFDSEIASIVGGEVKLNVFVQEEEPATKEGIWVKSIPKLASDSYKSDYNAIPFALTNTLLAYYKNSIYIVNSEAARGTIVRYDMATDSYDEDIKTLPYAKISIIMCQIDNLIYMFGGSSPKVTTAYVYDLETMTARQLADVPVAVSDTNAVSIGTDIYFAYGYNMYKYNTLTDSYETINLQDLGLDVALNGNVAVAVDTDIYIFGSYQQPDSANTKLTYKYDTINNTLTQVSSSPVGTPYAMATKIGNLIYLTGSNCTATPEKVIAYNPAKDEYTEVATNAVRQVRGGSIVVEGKWHLFGSTRQGVPTAHTSYDITSLEGFDNIETTDKVASDEFTWDTSKSDIPYSFWCGSAVSVGTAIYLFGSNDNSTNCYKYDTLTDTYTQMNNIPYGFFQGSAVAIGTDIYLLGGSTSTISCYKYNTLTDSYTQLANIPYDFGLGAAVAVGTDIYLFGGYYRTNLCYKYNTLTDSYTQLANIPYYFYSGSAVLIGTDIYLFGSENSTYYQGCYKYDTLTDTYTQMTNIPYRFYYGAAVLIGTDIYLLGGNESAGHCYKYDTLTDTYTKLADIPYGFNLGSVALVVTDIYLLGSRHMPTKVQVMDFPLIEFTDKTVIILNGAGLKTELVPTDVINGLKYSFANTYYYTTEGGLNETMPVYIGDGTEWNKIRGDA